MLAPPRTPFDVIERDRDEIVAELQECCRIPSVAGAPDDPQLLRMAAWLHQRLEPLMDRVETLPVDGAPPAVVGWLAGEGPGTVLLYSHYDVQPVEPLDEWPTPPFAAEIVDGAVIARGVCDDKSDVVARLQALRAWRETRGRPPCSIVWLSEGAEEIGSPGLAAFLERHSDALAADAVLWESYLVRDDDRPEIAFGCRGPITP